ncbi:MAG: potassium-transporting ATPase subunit C [Bacteroidetes bacterium]|nr:MAG: potassium-transporting ATPase subunit C [Bacteroidota bacterium]
MKQHIIPALKLTLVTIVFFCGIYTIFILAVAQAAPGKGRGVTITVKDKIVGYALEGQKFDQDKYFWSRPSAVNYNAAGSAGSNKGPTNPDYLKQVQDRIDTFLVHNPGIKKEEIPADLVTASGSGLDPDISVASAKVQVKRIARVRNLDENALNALIAQHTDKPLLGFMGPEKINVLKLNIALDELKK